MAGRKWTTEEEEILSTAYPRLGYRVCQLFPDRTKAAVLRKAERMNLKVDRKYRNTYLDDRIGYLDIEASNLNANFGIMFSWCIKEQGKEEIEYSIITREELMSGELDKRVVRELVEAMQKYTVIYTYYGSRFDIPFIRTRALMHNIEFPPYGEILHRDLYYLVRSRLKLNRNSLDVACGVLGIEGKTHINWNYWIKGMTGDPESLNYILEHNKYDVIILEKLHEKLAEFETRGRRYL